MDSKLGDEHYMGEGLPQDEIHYSEENPMQVNKRHFNGVP
jgi:hypothetical protein